MIELTSYPGMSSSITSKVLPTSSYLFTAVPRGVLPPGLSACLKSQDQAIQLQDPIPIESLGMADSTH